MRPGCCRLSFATLVVLTLAATAAGGADRPHVVLVVGEDHFYGADQSLPELAQELQRKHGLRCTVLRAASRTNIPGLETLRQADLAIFYIRRRLLPPEQIRYVREYLDAGKPLMAFRTTTHAFQPFDGDPPKDKVRWDDFDREVLGCRYGGYAAGETRVWAVAEAAQHPVLGDFDGPYQVRETLYRSLPLAESCQVLLMGTSVDGPGDDTRYRKRPGSDEPDQPLAWVNTYKSGSRIFYTSMGHRPTFQQPWFRRLVLRVVFWLLDRKMPVTSH